MSLPERRLPGLVDAADLADVEADVPVSAADLVLDEGREQRSGVVVEVPACVGYDHVVVVRGDGQRQRLA